MGDWNGFERNVGDLSLVEDLNWREYDGDDQVLLTLLLG